MTTKIEKEIKNLDLKNVSLEKIEQFFSENIIGHSRPTINCNFEGLFRARIVNNISEQELLKTKCIWYPDWVEIDENNHQYNRCSDKGQNFFYCSNYLEATIKELNPKHNDLIIVGVFSLINPKTKITSQFAGIETLKKNPNYSSLLENFKFENSTDKEIEEFIASKFQEKFLKKDSYKYKVSIAFSNILLKNDYISCIIYPSVASNLEYANFGIKPNIIDSYFTCSKLYMYKVKKMENIITIIPEKYAHRIIPDYQNSKNSTVEWKNNNLEEKLRFIKYVL